MAMTRLAAAASSRVSVPAAGTDFDNRVGGCDVSELDDALEEIAIGDESAGRSASSKVNVPYGI